jgi:hypothetical protein
MAVTYHDRFDGNAGRFTADGWEFYRIAIVTGVTGEGHAKIYNAAQELGVDINDAHPTVTSCKLREVLCESVDKDVVKLRLVYRRLTHTGHSYTPQLDTVEIGANLSQKETNKDVNDVVMQVQYEYPADYTHDSDYAGKTLSQSPMEPIFIPQPSIVISKAELFSPLAKAKEYVATMNLAGWNLDPTAPAKTWLCTGIVGRSNDAGLNYTTTYSFQYNASTWDKTIVYFLEHTGRPPTDLVDGTGIKDYQVYQTKNFNALGLG